MEAKTIRPYLIVILLLSALSWVLAHSVDVSVTDEAGIRMALPEAVADWKGFELRYCHSPSCLKTVKIASSEIPPACPGCESELHIMSYPETQLLPNDTVIRRKVYRAPSGKTLQVSAVLSGKERTSIHRPQICLRGQGRKILKSYVRSVPLEGREPLDVMILDLVHPAKTHTGETIQIPTYYAYWFAGKDRETPYHIHRLFWMGVDRVFRNVAHRWAYIAIGGSRGAQGKAHTDEIKAFVQHLYPQIVPN